MNLKEGLKDLHNKWHKFRDNIKAEMKEQGEKASFKVQLLDFLIWLWEHKIGVVCFIVFVYVCYNVPIQEIGANLLNSYLLPFFMGVLKILFIIIAVFNLITWLHNLFGIEKEYELSLIQTEKKINFKKGFNRLSVILSSILTFFSFVIFIMWQWTEYFYNDEKLIKLFWGLVIIVIGTLLTYCLSRLFYILIEKSVIWLFKGFKD